jgi:hypothetical protein
LVQPQGDIDDLRDRCFLRAELNQIDTSFDHGGGDTFGVRFTNVIEIQNAVEAAIG